MFRVFVSVLLLISLSGCNGTWFKLRNKRFFDNHPQYDQSFNNKRRPSQNNFFAIGEKIGAPGTNGVSQAPKNNLGLTEDQILNPSKYRHAESSALAESTFSGAKAQHEAAQNGMMTDEDEKNKATISNVNRVYTPTPQGLEDMKASGLFDRYQSTNFFEISSPVNNPTASTVGLYQGLSPARAHHNTHKFGQNYQRKRGVIRHYDDVMARAHNGIILKNGYISSSTQSAAKQQNSQDLSNLWYN